MRGFAHTLLNDMYASTLAQNVCPHLSSPSWDPLIGLVLFWAKSCCFQEKNVCFMLHAQHTVQISRKRKCPSCWASSKRSRFVQKNCAPLNDGQVIHQFSVSDFSFKIQAHHPVVSGAQQDTAKDGQVIQQFSVSDFLLSFRPIHPVVSGAQQHTATYSTSQEGLEDTSDRSPLHFCCVSNQPHDCLGDMLTQM